MPTPSHFQIFFLVFARAQLFFYFPSCVIFPCTIFMDTRLKDILMEAVDDTVVASQFNGGGVDFLSSVMDNFIRVYSERFGEDETAAVLAWEKPVVQNLLAAIELL